MFRRLTLALAALLLIAGVASAQSHRYRFIIQGDEMGQETFTITESDSTLALTGEVRFFIPKPMAMEVQTVVRADDLSLIDYVLTASMGGNITARPDSTGILMSFVGGPSSQDKFVESGTEPFLLLDNTVTQHLWLLGRDLLASGRDQKTYQVLVPQKLFNTVLEVRKLESGQGLQDGNPVTVLRYRLKIAGVVTELQITESGEVLAMLVPIQQFQILREGYEPYEALAADTKRHHEIEISVEGGGPPLGGTLTLPDVGQAPWPAAILLHGSGPNDRDETLGPNRIFFQLAQKLADRGIATLRYDKRTWVFAQQGRGTEDEEVAALTLKEEVLDDAVAAFQILAAREEVNTDRLFIVGHSLGAAAAPAVSSLLEKEGYFPSGLVLMAPPGRDILSLMQDQYAFLHEIGNLPTEQLERIQQLGDRLRKGQVGEDEVILYGTPRYWHSVLFWDPPSDYLKQSSPALALFGGRDYQVPAVDRQAWQAAMDANPREGSRVEVFDSLNHLFLEGEGTPGPAEYGIPGELDENFLETIADWMTD